MCNTTTDLQDKTVSSRSCSTLRWSRKLASTLPQLDRPAAQDAGCGLEILRPASLVRGLHATEDCENLPRTHNRNGTFQRGSWQPYQLILHVHSV